jgi:hypothetical protein
MKMSFFSNRPVGFAIALAGVICVGGCSTVNEVAGPFATNVKSRLLDFVDPVSCGVGLGLGASARVTNYVQGGALYTQVKNSFRGRKVRSPIQASPELGMSPLFHVRSIDDPDTGFDGRAVVAGKTFVDTSEERWSGWAVDENWQWVPYRSEYAADYDRHLLDIGISAYGLVGFDLAINLIETPYEMVDFVIGLATLGFIDLAGDDYTWEGPKLLDTVAGK